MENNRTKNDRIENIYNSIVKEITKKFGELESIENKKSIYEYCKEKHEEYSKKNTFEDNLRALYYLKFQKKYDNNF